MGAADRHEARVAADRQDSSRPRAGWHTELGIVLRKYFISMLCKDFLGFIPIAS